ncbi:hypothetical protein [Agrobacterium tumefaciens]|uniref:hypothetical protein n=1 Tax=Agrobacterium tumefaciens TaxID=358 RepID=UPI0015746D7C|nr:hypothetical protein [Agrobacterium tumefaciens]
MAKTIPAVLFAMAIATRMRGFRASMFVRSGNLSEIRLILIAALYMFVSRDLGLLPHSPHF